ncbi:AhpD-like protein [Stachybotrys elegans]|uniref:AhpD-like protein n=1 Tax=Stachybotrys elegans TaxID=80388 RepID=A0A8K0SH33_9HYPO|nr:AhpD-like protein [Stachybotrys elegans]
MASRFPLMQAPDPEIHKMIASILTEIHNGPPAFPILQEDGDTMLGPYAAFSYTPEMAKAFFTMSKTCYSPEHIKPRNRGLAIMALCSVFHLPYIVYCHRIVGQKLGFSDQQIDDAMAGKEPQGLTSEESAAYRLGRVLSTDTGPISDAVFDDISSNMDKSQVVAVTNIVGGYLWIAKLVQVNGHDSRWG